MLSALLCRICLSYFFRIWVICLVGVANHRIIGVPAQNRGSRPRHRQYGVISDLGAEWERRWTG